MNFEDILFKTISSNPNYKKVMEMIGNRNPKDVFLEECQKRGVDPSSITNLFNGKEKEQ